MKSISRKQFLLQSALGLGSVMIFSGLDFTSTKTDGDFVIGKTAFGKVRGTRERDVNIFKGIPYGGSVSADYRFARPASAGTVEWSMRCDQAWHSCNVECEVISDRNKSERELWASLGYLGNQD